MATELTVGAVSNTKENWQAIDWQKINRNVRRLQSRIVKATKENKWGRVKALQHLLTRSFSGKVLAVRRVTENTGKKTPGVDADVWDSPDKKASAIKTLKQRGYKALPLRRIYIAKNNGNGLRPISIPTMRDRAMQSLYLLALDPVAETTADENSYGFRSQRSPADAIERIHHSLIRKNAAEWILDADIRSCFDKISFQWLLENIPMEKSILKRWLKAGFIEKQTFYPTEEGVPQGGCISPVLMNMTLDGLEQILKEKFPRNTRKTKNKVNFVRFADDLLVTGRTPQVLEKEVKPIVEQFLAQRGLELSKEKTRIVKVTEGFDFLGQNIRKYSNGKVLSKPAKKSIKSLLNKVKAILKENKQATAGNLIVRLNPVIRGWANYHQHAASKQTFRRLNHNIFQMIWKWSERRHPNKTAKWVRKKYYRTQANRNWVFFGSIETNKNETKEVSLYDIALTPVTRHVKIKGEANPYDVEWEEYFEHRLGIQMAKNLKGRYKLLNLWMEQKGICPICNQKITKITGWHSHHIIWRSKGGSDGNSNRVLLHPQCHSQVHCQGLSVLKPRPNTGV